MKRSFFRVPVILLLISLFPAFQVFADSGSFPRLSPSPEAGMLASSFNPSDWKTQVPLALWASGGRGDGSETIEALMPYIEDLIRSTGGMEERDKAERVLEFMHEGFLKNYSLKQTRFDTLLQTGRYNCVSSAVLYAVLGTSVGLDVAGVSTIDHAFCSVDIGGELADVETTSPYGFEPGKKKEFHDAFGKTTGFAYVPPRNYSDRRSIDLLNLFSLILSNRMSDAEAAGDYTLAVELAADRLALLGGDNEKAFNELIDRMVNYGVYLSGEKREYDALRWAEQAVSVYGGHQKWNDFTNSAANNLIVRLLRSNNVPEARTRLEELRPRLNAATAETLDVSISDAELLAALQRAEDGGAESDFYTALSAAEEAGVLPSSRISEIHVFWRLKKIEKTARDEGWASAYEETKRAIDEIGSERQLENALKVYRGNRIAELYNAAVTAYNSGDYREALRLAEDAVLQFPDEKNLQTLRNAAEKALSETSRM